MFRLFAVTALILAFASPTKGTSAAAVASMADDYEASDCPFQAIEKPLPEDWEAKLSPCQKSFVNKVRVQEKVEDSLPTDLIAEALKRKNEGLANLMGAYVAESVREELRTREESVWHEEGENEPVFSAWDSPQETASVATLVEDYKKMICEAEKIDKPLPSDWQTRLNACQRQFARRLRNHQDYPAVLVDVAEEAKKEEMKDLLELASAGVAASIRGKTTAQIRDMFRPYIESRDWGYLFKSDLYDAVNAFQDSDCAPTKLPKEPLKEGWKSQLKPCEQSFLQKLENREDYPHALLEAYTEAQANGANDMLNLIAAEIASVIPQMTDAQLKDFQEGLPVELGGTPKSGGRRLFETGTA